MPLQLCWPHLMQLMRLACRVVDRGQFFNWSVSRSVSPPPPPPGPTYVDLRTMCGTWYRRIPEYTIPLLHTAYGKWHSPHTSTSSSSTLLLAASLLLAFYGRVLVVIHTVVRDINKREEREEECTRTVIQRLYHSNTYVGTNC